MGSVFSPYYAWAGRGDPLNHCAVNVALYGASGHRWAMTERGRRAVRREADTLVVGPSSARWEGDALVIRLAEVTCPWPSRLRGTVRLHPLLPTRHVEVLDAPGRHRWWPLAPLARVEVNLERPALRWSGHGYLDANAGEEPLEAGFVEWDWGRAAVGDEAVVHYDVHRRDEARHRLALRFRTDGRVEPLEPPPQVELRRTLWRVRRRVPCEAGHRPRVEQTLEDTPFYARSLVDTRLLGRPVRCMHESLLLDRFSAGWVRTLLPFRMPRRG